MLPLISFYRIFCLTLFTRRTFSILFFLTPVVNVLVHNLSFFTTFWEFLLWCLYWLLHRKMQRRLARWNSTQQLLCVCFAFYNSVHTQRALSRLTLTLTHTHQEKKVGRFVCVPPVCANPSERASVSVCLCAAAYASILSIHSLPHTKYSCSEVCDTVITMNANAVLQMGLLLSYIKRCCCCVQTKNKTRTEKLRHHRHG